MRNIPVLLERNAATQERHEVRPIRPAMNVVILSCLDARADPAHFVGLQPGDALVIRNAGGRVTEDVEQQLGLLAAMVKQLGAPLFELVIVHHTDCGMERLAAEEVRARIAGATGLPRQALDRLAIHDHGTSLDEDVERLRSSALVPSGLRVTGLRYHHDTGAAEVVLEETLS